MYYERIQEDDADIVGDRRNRNVPDVVANQGQAKAKGALKQAQKTWKHHLQRIEKAKKKIERLEKQMTGLDPAKDAERIQKITTKVAKAKEKIMKAEAMITKGSEQGMAGYYGFGQSEAEIEAAVAEAESATTDAETEAGFFDWKKIALVGGGIALAIYLWRR